MHFRAKKLWLISLAACERKLGHRPNAAELAHAHFPPNHETWRRQNKHRSRSDGGLLASGAAGAMAQLTCEGLVQPFGAKGPSRTYAITTAGREIVARADGGIDLDAQLPEPRMDASGRRVVEVDGIVLHEGPDGQWLPLIPEQRTA